MLDFLVLVLGLISGYLLLNLFYDELSLPKLFSGTVALYLSLAAIIAYYFSALGLALSTSNFIAAFSAIALLGLILIRIKGKVGVVLDIDTLYLLTFAGIFLFGFFYFAYPALPSLYPISESAPALRHFTAAQHIIESQELPAGIYPLGMHLNIALLSKALGLPLIKGLYLSSVLFAALSAAVAFALVVELTGNKRLSALFSAFFMLFSGYINHALSISASWEMLFGAFLTLVMIWFLAEQAPERHSNLLVPAIIQGALILGCASWALVGLLTFFLIQIFEGIGFRTRAVKLSSFLLLAGGFSLPAVRELLQGILKCLQNVAYIEDPVTATGTIFIVLALVGIPSVQKANRVLPAFLGATLALPVLMFLYSLQVPGGTYSGYYSSYFFLYYPMAIFATLGVETLLERWREMYSALAAERLLANGMLLLLLLIGSGIVFAQTETARQFRGSNLPLTPEEYRAASWVGENVPAGEKLTFVNFEEGEKVNWMVAISKHGTDYSERWVVIKDSESVSQEKLDQFELFYKTGGIEVLKKKGVPAS